MIKFGITLASKDPKALAAFYNLYFEFYFEEIPNINVYAYNGDTFNLQICQSVDLSSENYCIQIGFPQKDFSKIVSKMIEEKYPVNTEHYHDGNVTLSDIDANRIMIYILK